MKQMAVPVVGRCESGKAGLPEALIAGRGACRRYMDRKKPRA